jgi:hypothetical protein
MVSVPFQAFHLELLYYKPLADSNALGLRHAETLQRVSKAATTLLYEGEVVCCYGVVFHHANRAEAWCVVHKGLPRAATIGIIRHIRKAISVLACPRLEATVMCKFKEGHRFVRGLGFVLECERMRKYLPNGEDASLYVRVE